MAIADKELLFTFELAPFDASFQVIRLEGREAISQAFEFQLILVSDQADIDLDAALQASATLTIRSRDQSQSVPYHGMLANIQQLGYVNQYYFYQVCLVPRLWKAGLNRLNEVYLNEQALPDIITQVLERNNLRGPDVRLLLKNPSAYRARSFTCQYQESDLNFLSRWMEQEGLYYYFDHDSGTSGEVLTILDHLQAQPDHGLSLRYTPPENVQTDRQDSCVTAFTCSKTQLPGTALVQDFNYRKASLGDSIRHKTDITQGTQGCYMLYGQNLRTEDDAQRLATVCAEGINAQGTVYQGEAPAVGVRSGYFLDVTHHFRDSFNARYLVTQVQHQGSQAGVVLAGQNTPYNREEQGSTYHCQFQAIPADLQYRAPRITPRPSIHGVISAVVDAEGNGKLAEINEYGQYKVQLPYDYSEKPLNKGSSWLRMATPYAGKFEGMHFPLLRGTEVLLAFNQGDPDQPVILGAVPNSEHQSIVRNVNYTSNAVRTVGGNFMNMSDQPGREFVGVYSPVKSSMFYIGTLPQAGSKDQAPSPASDPVSILSSL
ncbi:type VI secretion system Vgr family protein [Castellaniella sp.]|uniref:type VI secretion system Vgr family protein n=1 Tax=Castellaniella sp. TaxID=1955812 RepID=UPI002B002F9A|nr:type VI secretion system tip protein TssI/VgrG [Castellaniella sp.]